MPSLRNSRHFFSLPCQCIRSKTLPLRRGPFHRLSVAGRILSMPRPCCSSHFFASPFHCRAVNALPLLCTAVPCLRLACLCFSVPLHSSSPHSRCHAPLGLALPLPLFTSRRYAIASLCHALPLPRLELHRHRTANRTQPCHCQAMPLQSIAALRLRESGPSMPCRCSQAFTS